MRDDKIIDIKVTKGKQSFIIRDSYPMLSGSLLELGKSYAVDTIKSELPYLFATEDNLFYQGPVPKKQYYPESLRDLCKTFNTENRKGYFPHNFVESSKLSYSGVIPEKRYFEPITQ